MAKHRSNKRGYKGRAPIPPKGGPMRAKQDKRRQTRQALKEGWREEFEAEQEQWTDHLTRGDEYE